MMSRLIVSTFFLFAACGLARAGGLPLSTEPVPKELPMNKMAPAKLIPNLCMLKYRISTTSPECQDFFDQGLGYMYSYVWMEAVRSFETATVHDPECPMAWWGLSRAMEVNNKKNWKDALKKAQDLLDKASHREKMLITARLQEKGLIPELKDKEAQTKAAIKTLDELLAIYEDDQEGWYLRGLIACGNKNHGGNVSAVPFYKALLRINPIHPGANHELVHFYESFRRPALGWPHGEKYIESSPGLAHAWHMQAHLGMRIGKWEKTTDYSWKAVEMEKAYHKAQGITPKQDSQYSHHLEVLTTALIHDGRFEEARQIQKESQKHGYKFNNAWFKMYMKERNYEDAFKLAGPPSEKNKTTLPMYWRAMVHLAKGDLEAAETEIAAMQKAFEKNKKDKKTGNYLLETEGILKCRQGDVDEGLKKLQQLSTWSANDFGAHAWGHGAYFMETWGLEALRANRLDVAEEAFQEAIAHDPSGSVRGALGMQIVCERQSRAEEAKLFADLALRCWRSADAGCIESELAAMRELQPVVVTPKEKEAKSKK
jgi:tetratricopeptide (TPR) repeat protein